MGLRIAIAKPDYRIMGGYEVVLQQIAQGLQSKGHTVEMAFVDATGDPTSHLTAPVSEAIWRTFPEFFNHANLALRFEELDLSRYDVVISTQPPSYAVRHPRHVSLFSHHFKICYDMESAVIAAGLYDETLMRLGADIVREIDREYLTPELPILACSYHVKQRFAAFNGLTDNVGVYYAGIDDDYFHYQGPTSFQAPISVGRHEFPKRPELFLHAMKHLPEKQGRVVGVGGRTEALKQIDTYLTHRHLLQEQEVDDRALWLETVFQVDQLEIPRLERELSAKGLASNVHFTGRVTKDQLIREYANALCVVCPSYEEDYGLTAIEAMAFGKPVIACEDGGGYTELITPGVDGFVVPPTGEAIAAAIRELSDPDRLKEMSANAYRKSREFTWDRAYDQIEQALLATAR